MPIYTYECQSCSDTLEKRQSFSEDPLTIHETCGGKLRRIIHPAGIVFKGSGFYNTDYKNATPATKPAGDATADDTKKTETAASDSSGSTSASPGDSASTSSTPAPAKSESASSAPAPSTP